MFVMAAVLVRIKRTSSGFSVVVCGCVGVEEISDHCCVLIFTLTKVVKSFARRSG